MLVDDSVVYQLQQRSSVLEVPGSKPAQEATIYGESFALPTILSNDRLSWEDNPWVPGANNIKLQLGSGAA